MLNLLNKSGKQIHGRKRHLSVDLLGLVLRVLVTSASVPERAGAKKVLKGVNNMGDSPKGDASRIALIACTGFGWMGDIEGKNLCVG